MLGSQARIADVLYAILGTSRRVSNIASSWFAKQDGNNDCDEEDKNVKSGCRADENVQVLRGAGRRGF